MKKCKYLLYGMLMDECGNKKSKNYGKDNYFYSLPCKECPNYKKVKK